MKLKLHKLARTTPAIRKEIKNSPLSAAKLSKDLGLSLDTIYKWKKRDDVSDKSHKRHNLLSSLSLTEEEIVVELRKNVGLSLDDITEVINRSVNSKLTRSSIYRTIKRRNVSKKPCLHTLPIASQPFEEITECGHIHMQLKCLTNLEGNQSYLYIIIDKLKRYVYAEILYDREPQTASGFIERFIKHFPYKVIKMVSNNGFEWTSRSTSNHTD